MVGRPIKIAGETEDRVRYETGHAAAPSPARVGRRAPSASKRASAGLIGLQVSGSCPDLRSLVGAFVERRIASEPTVVLSLRS